MVQVSRQAEYNTIPPSGSARPGSWRRTDDNPLPRRRADVEAGSMSDRDDIKQPLDHLPPQEERDETSEIEEPNSPDPGGSADTSAVSPETAAEPDRPNRHGVDKL